MAGDQERSLRPNPAASSSRDQSSTTTLYVGDLEENVTESQLEELFSQIGQVHSVRVCKSNSAIEKPLNYGYVKFINSEDAETALKKLNLSELNGKRIRVMHGNPDYTGFGSEDDYVFITNLDKGVDERALIEILKVFGNVVAIKVATDDDGESKGHGFAQFENEECARRAVRGVKGMVLNGKRVYVGPYLRREDRVFTGGMRGDEAESLFVNDLAEYREGDEAESVLVKNLAECKEEKMIKLNLNAALFSPTRPPVPPYVARQTPMNLPRPAYSPHDFFGYQPQLFPAIHPNEPLPPRPLFHCIPPQMPPGFHDLGLGFQMPEAPMLGISRGIGIDPLHEAPRPIHSPIGNFATPLVIASPEQLQHQIVLANALFLHVQPIFPYRAATITDMIISNVHPNKVLQLLRSQEALRKTVEEFLKFL